MAREGGDAPQLGVDRLVLTSGDGDDEGDLVGRPTPRFSGLFAAQIRVIDLHVALKLVGSIALAHDLHQLLLDKPGGVPFHAQLAGKLE